MKTIVFFATNIGKMAGIERISIDLMNKLANDNNVSVIAYYKIDKIGFKLDDRIKVYYLYDEVICAKKSIYRGIKFRKIVKEISPDTIVYVDTIWPFFLNRFLFGLSIKKIAWEHFNWTINWGKLTGLFARKYCLLTMDKVVVLSDADKKYWEKIFYHQNKVIKINNFIRNDIEQIDCSKTTKKENFVITVGRFENQKGFDMLLDIWSIIENKFDNWILKIIGDGREKSILEEKSIVLGLKKVKFCGAVKDVAKEYATAKIQVMTSRFEGFPLVLIEGKFFGLPQVAFDVDCGPSELIDGDGYLVDAFNIEEFAKKLSLIMSDNKLQAAMSKKALENSKKYLSSEILKEWEKIL